MKSYVKTPSEIRHMVASMVTSLGAIESFRGDYLKCLLATTQKQLQDQPETTPAAALAEVHERFYAEVVAAAVTPEIAAHHRLSKDESARRAQERGRRTNFARSAKSTLAAWMRVDGHNILKLDPEKVSKGYLANQTPARRTGARKVSADVLAARIEQRTEAALKDVAALARTDASQARSQLEAMIETLNDTLNEVKAEEKPKTATRRRSGTAIHLNG